MKHVFHLRGTKVFIKRFVAISEGYRIYTKATSYAVTSNKMCNFLSTAEAQNKKTLFVSVVKRFCGEALHFTLEDTYDEPK